MRSETAFQNLLGRQLVLILKALMSWIQSAAPLGNFLTCPKFASCFLLQPSQQPPTSYFLTHTLRPVVRQARHTFDRPFASSALCWTTRGVQQNDNWTTSHPWPFLSWILGDRCVNNPQTFYSRAPRFRQASVNTLSFPVWSPCSFGNNLIRFLLRHYTPHKQEGESFRETMQRCKTQIACTHSHGGTCDTFLLSDLWSGPVSCPFPDCLLILLLSPISV